MKSKKYIEGPKAKENFEKTMKILFQARKPDSKKPKKGKD
jgi:hypothetical protein